MIRNTEINYCNEAQRKFVLKPYKDILNFFLDSHTINILWVGCTLMRSLDIIFRHPEGKERSFGGGGSRTCCVWIEYHAS
jgi:hypothetical protein